MRPERALREWAGGDPRPVSVAELAGRIAGALERDPGLVDIWVEGEITEAKIWSAGQLYFTLADGEAQVSCVFWDARTRLSEVPRSGERVLVRGRAGIYARRGQLQFVAIDVRRAGAGEGARALEALRRRLQAEGLFRESRKRPLPAHPRAVGVVTSLSGAVLHDILKVSARRDPGLPLVVAGVRVQGAGAGAEIAEAVRRLGASGRVDVVVVARGGGGVDDLAAFNDETVVRAIAECPVPVVAAVGHETDVTLADFAADRRAVTPSQAAELVVPSRDETLRRVDEAEERLRHALARTSEAVEARVAHAEVRLASALRLDLERAQGRLARAAAALDAVSPLATLARGYAVVAKGGHPVATAGALAPGDRVKLRFQDGEKDAEVC